MNSASMQHPPDKVLTEYALGEKQETTRLHIQKCPSCARFVKEIVMVRERVATIEDEEIPPTVQHKILSIPKKKYFVSACWHSLSSHKSIPFLIGIGVTLAVIFFYIFFVFVL
ncbi:MAG: hypothetical protein GF401_17055 [Chitinivibrionales bacterium]|nr:hypothetical protein [Chitinivibrionales bacterium]